jgi:hypothetical protein
VRARALLPHSLQWTKIDESHGVLSGTCLCGELIAGSALIAETGSSIEWRCPNCRRFIQLRASHELTAEGGAPGSAKKGNGHA